MLEVLASRRDTNCAGLSRRDFLRTGTLGATGLTLSNLLRARAAGASPEVAVTDTTVIWLFLAGGPSHFETFDPKPGNSAPHTSVVGATKTNVIGTHIGGLFPKLAQYADKFSIIRSFTHTAADHAAATHWLSSGKDHPPAANGAAQVHPGIGSMLAKFRGPNHVTTGLPTYVATDRLYADGPAWLGAAYGPFDPRGNALANMTARIDQNRLDDRRTLMEAFDKFDRSIDKSGMAQALDEFDVRALDLIRGKRAREAFDLSHEDIKLRDRYGQDKKGLGQNLLLARRLAEAGVGCITIWYGGWDSHGTNPSVGHGTIEQEMHKLAPDFDHAVPVFIEDLYDRGLDKKVLLAIVGEFGRSPHMTKEDGRDHWPHLGNLVLCGGGMKMGQIIGESDAKGGYPKSNPVSPQDFLATLFQFLGMPLNLQFQDPTGRPVSVLEGAKPIAELVGE
jgi:hypothetical protein